MSSINGDPLVAGLVPKVKTCQDVNIPRYTLFTLSGGVCVPTSAAAADSTVLGIFGDDHLAGTSPSAPTFSQLGAHYPMLWDGSASAAAGSRVGNSATVNGSCGPSSGNGFGVLLDAAPAAAGVVKVLFVGAGASGGSFTYTGELDSPVVDGATAVANILNSTNAFNTIGDKLLSLRSAGTEAVFVGQPAGLGIWELRSANTNIGLRDINNNGFIVQSDVVYAYAGGVAKYIFSATAFVPFAAYASDAGSTANPFGNVVTRHIAGASAAIPTIVAGAGAGTTPTVAVAAGSTDLAGTITVTTGTLPTGAAVISTITYNTAYTGAAPPRVILVPANAAAAALAGVTQAFVAQSGGSINASFAITAGPTGLAATTAYSWNYMVIQ